MTENLYEIEFRKLNLDPSDTLIIKVNNNGLSPEKLVEKVEEIKNDDFFKYIEEQGNKVIVSYSGIDFQILRMQEKDKVLVYADVSSMTEEECEEYEKRLTLKFKQILGESMIYIPVKNGSPVVKIKNGDNND